MRIEFDERNLMADMAGKEHGLSAAELRSGAPIAKKALSGFHKSWQKGLHGFPDLPTQAETIAEVKKYARSVEGDFDTICVAGIGGSALGAWAIDCALRGPHPVQKAFQDHHAFQCGYCTSGMIMAAWAFLKKKPKASRAEIVAAMEGNLCRCGAHVRILDAVESAGKVLGGVR